jgi:hypothetical protein
LHCTATALVTPDTRRPQNNHHNRHNHRNPFNRHNHHNQNSIRNSRPSRRDSSRHQKLILI